MPITQAENTPDADGLFALEKSAVKHTIIPQITNLNDANIRISATLSVFILKTLYPIFINGNREPQKSIVISGKIRFVKTGEFLFTLCTRLILPFLHFRRFVKSNVPPRRPQWVKPYIPKALFHRFQA